MSRAWFVLVIAVHVAFVVGAIAFDRRKRR